jgi:hypothetical protein
VSDTIAYLALDRREGHLRHLIVGFCSVPFVSLHLSKFSPDIDSSLGLLSMWPNMKIADQMGSDRCYSILRPFSVEVGTSHMLWIINIAKSRGFLVFVYMHDLNYGYYFSRLSRAHKSAQLVSVQEEQPFLP